MTVIGSLSTAHYLADLAALYVAGVLLACLTVALAGERERRRRAAPVVASAACPAGAVGSCACASCASWPRPGCRMNLNDFCAMALGDCVNAGPDEVPASILPPACETCDGNGEIEEACGRDSFGVWETDVWPCPDCHGSGDA